MFIKTARKSHRCGECVHCKNTKCEHPEMNGKTVEKHALCICGGKYYKPKDDYENN